jgi:hypothetical protein
MLSAEAAASDGPIRTASSASSTCDASVGIGIDGGRLMRPGSEGSRRRSATLTSPHEPAT